VLELRRQSHPSQAALAADPALGTGVVGAPGGIGVPGGTVGCIGNQALPLVWSVVWSTTSVAVVVPPETVPVTSTVSPVLTLPIPDSPPFTLVDESTVKVPDVPSADFTVSDHVFPEVLETSETVPFRTSIVS
jgi:hypothetical protein